MLFQNFDLSSFWDDSDYFTGPNIVTDETIKKAEEKLGYRLPASYISLIKTKNGGKPVNTCFPTNSATTWAEDHIAISGIKGLGGRWGIDSNNFGNQHAIEEWGYPDIGIVVCECPSAGHDTVMLDYSKSGKLGEPRVVHVDIDEHEITFLANNFEEFILGLQNEEKYDASEQVLQEDLQKIEFGEFSDLLKEMTILDKSLDYELIIRNISKKLTREKGYFALHDDKLSYLIYDIQFLLFSKYHPVINRKSYLNGYSSMIALSDKQFSTNGYAHGFVEDWFDERLNSAEIIRNQLEQLVFSPPKEKLLFLELKEYL